MQPITVQEFLWHVWRGQLVSAPHESLSATPALLQRLPLLLQLAVSAPCLSLLASLGQRALAIDPPEGRAEDPRVSRQIWVWLLLSSPFGMGVLFGIGSRCQDLQGPLFLSQGLAEGSLGQVPPPPSTHLSASSQAPVADAPSHLMFHGFENVAENGVKEEVRRIGEWWARQSLMSGTL